MTGYASHRKFNPNVQQILSWSFGHENISSAILPFEQQLIQEDLQGSLNILQAFMRYYFFPSQSYHFRGFFFTLKFKIFIFAKIFTQM